MKKIPTLYVRSDSTHLVTPALVVPFPDTATTTEKIDGMSCYYHNFQLFRRSERHLLRKSKQRGAPFTLEDYGAAPDEWLPAQVGPDVLTGHWPGWMPVSLYNPEDQHHVEALSNEGMYLNNERTYELVGPKVQGNPYRLARHELWEHGTKLLEGVPDSFLGLRDYLCEHHIEGIVWWIGTAPYCKLKRKDFGIEWP